MNAIVDGEFIEPKEGRRKDIIVVLSSPTRRSK
jgi:hypothetical protein